MKNLQPREGFKNRHIDGLPEDICEMKIIDKDSYGENIILCEWTPLSKRNPDHGTPYEGYLGTVKVIERKHNGIGFHAWEQNDSEFIYYALV